MTPTRLSALEARVLGCLLEKERLTPENYPMSLNGLVNACNQSTNREPISTYSERDVEHGVDELRQRKLATMVMSAGARVQKYRHNLLDQYELDRREVGLLTVLLLRGAQTPGELRQRSERMAGFTDLPDVEACIQGLCTGDDPLVKVLPARPGQKERRYVQLLSEFVEPAPGETPTPSEVVIPPPPSRIGELETEVRALREELEALRTEFRAFREQF